MKAGGELPKGNTWWRTSFTPSRSLNAGKTYVDLMYPGVTEKFLDITLEAYRKHFGDEFGKGIPGRSRTSRRFGRGRVALDGDLPKQFEANGATADRQPSLPGAGHGRLQEGAPRLPVRVQPVFIERWAKPYFEYCEKNGLKFTGHYWVHEWPECLACPTTWPCTRGTNCPRSTT